MKVLDILILPGSAAIGYHTVNVGMCVRIALAGKPAIAQSAKQQDFRCEYLSWQPVGDGLAACALCSDAQRRRCKSYSPNIQLWPEKWPE
jgi:hypothetical protein